LKNALIFGVTGQDGAYLTDLLLKKDYCVHGVKRRHSNLGSSTRLDPLYRDPFRQATNLTLHYGDVTDAANVIDLVASVQPDEVYNLAAQSHVAVSFVQPTYTGHVDALGCLNILEAIRILGREDTTRFYQASTSELYGDVVASPQNEGTPFNPQSPYAVAKQYAFSMTKLYREAYGIFAVNGILFNHESPLRGETFVTRKITRGLARIHAGLQETISLGNLNAKRDWGHARDYVFAMWHMLQADDPVDYVIATGEQHSVRDFVELAANSIGRSITWRGAELEEIGVDQNGQTIINVHKDYYRPMEVETLLGDASRAHKDLGWVAETSFQKLVSEMMMYDIAQIAGESLNVFNLGSSDSR